MGETSKRLIKGYSLSLDMDEKAYDQRYGIDSSSSNVKSFHASRRMFAIKDNTLYLASEKVTYSHAKWFELECWMNSKEDSLMTTLTRGYFDSTGVYFYKGYDFIIDEACEKEMFSNLATLVNAASINTDTHLFGGKIKQKNEGEWPNRKDYGPINRLL